jgi:tRNA nucleotidyltransferase/poly(A) polymerase
MSTNESFRRAAERVLAPEVMDDLETASRVVEESGSRVLLVGGMVRDVLLGRRSRDIDLVVVGGGRTRTMSAEPARLAAALASALHGEASSPSELLTWRIELSGGRRLDLATARRETYATSAALPTVEPGDLEDDLLRRDFAINAMAVDIGQHWGDLVDPHRGQADLAGGLLRILHAGSFHDDPTRVLRGVELAVRLGFEFESHTARLAEEALAAGALDRLSPARWRVAWHRAFAPMLESGAEALVRGLGLAREIGLLAALDPGLRSTEAAAARAERLAERFGDPRFGDVDPARLLARALAWEDATVAASLAARWGLSPTAAGEWKSFGERLGAVRRDLLEGVSAPPSRLDAVLAGFDAEELCLLALAPALQESVERYWAELAPFRLMIGGHDLRARGHSPGPRFRQALERTRHARLDGLIGQEEELEYACRQLEGM